MVRSSSDSARVRSPWACQHMSATGLIDPAPLADGTTIPDVRLHGVQSCLDRPVEVEPLLAEV